MPDNDTTPPAGDDSGDDSGQQPRRHERAGMDHLCEIKIGMRN